MITATRQPPLLVPISPGALHALAGGLVVGPGRWSCVTLLPLALPRGRGVVAGIQGGIAREKGGGLRGAAVVGQNVEQRTYPLQVPRRTEG